MKCSLFPTVCTAFFIAAIEMPAVVTAGDLDPPIGPIGPTGRFGPRTEISDTKTPGDADSLFRISQPSSYYLSGNITGVSGKSGIKIATGEVTLDLNGFTLIGVPGSGYGIVVTPDQQYKITVKNGTVAGWGQDGVQLAAGLLIVARIHARDNAGWGIHANSNSVVSECNVANNGAGGIIGAHGGLIQNCTVHNNGGHGITGGSGFTVGGCQVSGNTGDGIYLYAGTGDGKAAVSVTACTIRRNGGIGINLATSGIVRGCVVNNNGGVGIQATDSLVVQNTATNNTGANISTTTSTVIDNHAP